MSTRRSLCRPARLRGWALFAGGPADAVVCPGLPGAGWRWAVGDSPPQPLLPEHLTSLPNRSGLGSAVELTEHLFAALLLQDLDDCDIRFHSREVPIADGSALPWLKALRAAGIRGPRREIKLSVRVDWQGQTASWAGGLEPGRARTFMRLRDALERRDLFRGARPGCAVLLDSLGGARYGGRPRLRGETAAHKLLDLLGDLSPWRSRGRLRGALHVKDPSHCSNPHEIARAFDEGRLAFEP